MLGQICESEATVTDDLHSLVNSYFDIHPDVTRTQIALGSTAASLPSLLRGARV